MVHILLILILTITQTITLAADTFLHIRSAVLPLWWITY